MFPILNDKEGTSLLAWTTTPWTLPSNVALCVNEDFDYVKVSSYLEFILTDILLVG